MLIFFVISQAAQSAFHSLGLVSFVFAYFYGMEVFEDYLLDYWHVVESGASEFGVVTVAETAVDGFKVI